MRKISKIEPKRVIIKPKKKVAAYARVSRDTERLLHSASAQVSYYSSMIQKNPDWQYAGVYADYGVSGTKVAKRDECCRTAKTEKLTLSLQSPSADLQEIRLTFWIRYGI